MGELSEEEIMGWASEKRGRQRGGNVGEIWGKISCMRVRGSKERA